jgi:hypothetical protein
MKDNSSMLKRVKSAFGGRHPRAERLAREAELERTLIDVFSGAGMIVRRQVPCLTGIADVVTDSTIFELKDALDRRSFQQAIGQLILYRQALNPMARTAIVCNSSSVPHLHDAARRIGVEVFIWSDIKRTEPFILANPPYMCGPKSHTQNNK